MKEFLLKYFFTPLKPLFESITELEINIAKAWVSNVHKRLNMIQWKITPHPEHFDHQIDLYYAWIANRNPLGWERGIYNLLNLKGKRVLELACGDGFNTRNFYSLKSESIVACDFDKKALKIANRKNSYSNIQYVLADIRTNMPEGKFENVVWDAAIEHFTLEEIDGILQSIKMRLTEDGILSGYTIIEKEGGKQLSHHEYEFKSKEDLFNLLSPFFKHLTVFETWYPTRRNLYFWSSDGILPFRENWPMAVYK